MSEERNCGATLYCTNKSEVEHAVENSMCENFGNEAVCGDSSSLKILGELRQIYEDRLRKIDGEASGDVMEIKLKALTSWINDLEEQNVILVQTVEQLEREAADRVALLEKRLKKSSHIALEYMSKLEDYDNRMLDISEEKNKPALMHIKASTRLVQAQQTEEILKTRVGNLQNDISSLLELIRRARYYGSWDTDGISFMEVTYEDIFGTHPNQISDKYGTIDHMQSTINVLHQKLRETLEDYHGKEREIMLLQEQVSCQKADIALKEVQLKCLAEKTEEFQVPAELKHIMHMVPKSIVCNVTVMSDNNTGESASEKVSLSQDDQSEEEITHVVPKSVVCDVAVMTDNYPVESDMEKVLLKQGNHQSQNEMPERAHVPPINKKGVCFASPSNEDYEEQIVELQKALKEAQNGTESATKHIAENEGNFMKDESQFTRHIEECRVNTVLAQAATEEVMEEIENLLDKLQTREGKIQDIEISIHSLQNSLKCSEQNINVLLRSLLNDGKKTDDIDSLYPSCQTTVQAVLQLLQSLKIERHDAACEKETKSMTVMDHDDISPKIVLKEIIILLEKLLQQQKEVPEKYLEIKHLQDNLKILLLEIKEVCEKIDEHDHNKEIWHHCQKQSEEKIKKLQLELESVQEDLEQSLKCFEPDDDSSSLHLE